MMNVFHAGDGNLHPLLVFDRREPGVLERVHAAGDEIVEACVAAGGVLSGEHGIGLEKRDYMPLVFSADDLDAQARLRDAFDPDGACNPQKVLPAGSRCGDLQHAPGGRVDLSALTASPTRSGPNGPGRAASAAARSGTSAARRRPDAREVRAPAGVVELRAGGDDRARAARARTVAELDAALAERGQTVALAGLGGRDGRRRAGRRPQRAAPARVGPGARHAARGPRTCRPRAGW